MPEDLEAVCLFYQKVIADLERRTNYPLWTWEVHPNTSMLSDALDQQQIWILDSDGSVAGCAMISSDLEGEETITWTGSKPQNIHLFAIDPDLGGRHLSDHFLSGLIEQTAKPDTDSFRLNLIEGNIPARRLYMRHGFISSGRSEVLLEDEGVLPFEFMELPLPKDQDR